MGNFKNIFKQLRLSNGLTQAEISSKLGISRSTIGMYETGAREPDFKTLEKIADFFNVDIDYLLGRNHKNISTETIGRYYTNEETAKAAQEIFENKELRALFDVQRDMDPEDLKALHNMALALKRKERGNDDGTGC